ncbi:hypothetical protein [Nostoc sp. FACHB-280]|uniref:hypothetical protein n=1 Tax=Nostoc sp. FACHB-280 TaxID=2692839 RepID=UPI00168BD6B4|nr:hypothetical protein [Nostoc sp. FACHB-280]MBD2498956.1 hypothetical protein [Nostoc sp. FACHB-280]
MISLIKRHWRLLACFLSGLVFTVALSWKMPVQQQIAFKPVYTQVPIPENQSPTNEQTLLSPFAAEHLEHNFYQ